MSHTQARKIDAHVKTQAARVLAVTLGSLALVAHAQMTPSPAPGTEPSPSTTPSTSPAAAAFSRADADADGKLSKKEASRLPTIAARFDALDKDKDGQLSELEFDSGITEKSR